MGFRHNASYTSKWGIEQAIGHHYPIAELCHGVNGSSWVSGMRRGSTYGTPYASMHGGRLGNSSNSGSRSGTAGCTGWGDDYYIGLRCCCDFKSLF